jgi:hypothetical protein
MHLIRKTCWISLALLPVFFLLHNYNEIFGFLPSSQLIKNGLIIYAAVGAGFLILRYLKVPVEKAVLILLLLAALNLFFEPIYQVFKNLTFGTPFYHVWVLLLIFLAVSFLLIRKILRTDRIPARLFRLLNLILVVLVATELVTIWYKGQALQRNKNLLYPDKTMSNNYIPSNIPDSVKPDIYFFVFDEYTNNKTLEKMWNFNNSSITDWLTSNQFFVPANSHANYNITFFSVPSTFNMNYISQEKIKEGISARNTLQASQSLSDNETFSMMEKENYDIRFIAPFKNRFQDNGQGQYVDYLVDHQIDMQTLPGKFIAKIDWGLQTGKASSFNDDEILRQLKIDYDTIRSAVDQIKKATDSNVHRKPHFVYGHLFITHEPHIFDSTGNYISQRSGINRPLFDTYISQVKYANSVIRELASWIMTHGRKNSIIIIEGDHGFRNFLEGNDYYRRTPDSLRKYFLPNFSAFYFPGGNYSRLYDNMSPVNTFRIVFNQYFHQNFPLLKDTGILVRDE